MRLFFGQFPNFSGSLFRGNKFALTALTSLTNERRAPKTFGPVRYYTRITNPPHTHHLPTTQLILTPSQRRRRQMIKVTLTSDRVSHNIRISFKDPTPFIDLTVKRGYRVRSLFSVLWPQKLKDYPCLDPFGSLVK